MSEVRTIAPSPNVSLVTTAPRLTPTPPRAARFGEVLAKTAVRTAESAVTSLPGAPMMALAVRGGAAPLPLSTTSSALTTPAASGKAAEGPMVSAGAPGTLGLGTPLDGGGGLEASLAQGHDQSMQMLALQQHIQQESQHFTTVSNVMKAQHDTVKTAIGNIR